MALCSPQMTSTLWPERWASLCPLGSGWILRPSKICRTNGCFVHKGNKHFHSEPKTWRHRRGERVLGGGFQRPPPPGEGEGALRSRCLGRGSPGGQFLGGDHGMALPKYRCPLHLGPDLPELQPPLPPLGSRGVVGSLLH